jgi:hypothetical protein
MFVPLVLVWRQTMTISSAFNFLLRKREQKSIAGRVEPERARERERGTGTK